MNNTSTIVKVPGMTITSFADDPTCIYCETSLDSGYICDPCYVNRRKLYPLQYDDRPSNDLEMDELKDRGDGGLGSGRWLFGDDVGRF